MPGGKGNIKPEDGIPFAKGNKIAEKYDEAFALQLGQDLIDWMNEDNGTVENMFFNEFLVMKRRLHPNLSSQLAKRFSGFSDLLDEAKKIQEIKMVKYGVGDKLNASMTKFVLANNHGYSDKKNIEFKGQVSNTNIGDLSKLTDDELEAYERIHNKIDPPKQDKSGEV